MLDPSQYQLKKERLFMDEQKQNDNSAPLDTAATEDDNYLPDDAKPLCPNCLQPCDPLQYYCPNCGSNQPINPLTPYIAFVNIRFNYDIFLTMWRKTFCEKQTTIPGRLFFLLMLVLFTPVFLVVGLPIWLIVKFTSKNNPKQSD